MGYKDDMFSRFMKLFAAKRLFDMVRGRRGGGGGGRRRY